MKRNASFVLIMALLASFFRLYFVSASAANATAPNIEVLIQGTDQAPSTDKIAECGPYNNVIELWHYSGGYWGYKNLKITDKSLGNNLLNPDALANALNEEIIFEIDINTDLYEKLIDSKDIKVFCSTTLPGKTLNDLFYGKPSIAVRNKKIYVSAKPKFHFYKGRLLYQDLIQDGELNVKIPIADPEYGNNLYAIWKRTSKVDWGGAGGYFDKNNPYAHAPEDSYKIAPSQIKNDSGHLISGFELKSKNIVRKSEDSSVGYYTFKNGGAVGIQFYYPIKFDFYSDKTESDISANFSLIPSSVKENEQVLAGIIIKSTFEEKVENLHFKWDIINKATNTPITTSFEGHALVREGHITEILPNGEVMLYTKFQMPNADVGIRFEINKDGLNPKETRLDNNILDATIKVVLPTPPEIGQFDLNYNILSKKVKYPVSEYDITAQLYLPRGNWYNNATGSLGVTNGTTDLLRNFVDTNNPYVDEDSTRIVRNPIINATIQRSDFGDKPIEGVWLPWSDPWTPKTRQGIVTYSGSVSRRYEYTEYCNSKCSGHYRQGTTSASFPSGSNIQNVRTFIYNGMPTIKPKIYDNKIDFNNTNSEQKNMYWTSEPYKYNVIRWMCHEDENGGLYNWTKVNGQYQRTFTQQNSAIIKWSTASTMKNDYYESRAAAKIGEQAKGKYDKAIFATDKTFKSLDYPIRSGYYFNPTGTYTFTVETVTYKPTQADTKEHKDLVNSAINAFRYESDLMYINKDKKAVNLQGELLPKNGNSFKRKAASLTAQDPTGVDGVVLLNVLDRTDSQSRYSKKVEEIYHTETSDGITHEYWKAILEGYIESETQGSEKFKYKEYVKAGQYMYRITEKTTVTIEINSGNKKVYTHAHMPDGKYTIKAWIDDAALTSGNNEYKKLGTLKGIASLDKIEVSVVGSMYEDTN